MVFKHYTHNLLFQCKYVMVEELVQFLVGVINAQLFEGVYRKVLETENVENAEESMENKC